MQSTKDSNHIYCLGPSASAQVILCQYLHARCCGSGNSMGTLVLAHRVYWVAVKELKLSHNNGSKKEGFPNIVA